VSELRVHVEVANLVKSVLHVCIAPAVAVPVAISMVHMETNQDVNAAVPPLQLFAPGVQFNVMEVSGVAVSVGLEIDGSAFGVIAEKDEPVSIPLDNAGITVPDGQAQISCTVTFFAFFQ
jgi:hypothetical protein